MPYANSRDADQPAHPHSLINTIVVRCLDTVLCQKHSATFEIPIKINVFVQIFIRLYYRQIIRYFQTIYMY